MGDDILFLEAAGALSRSSGPPPQPFVDVFDGPTDGSSITNQPYSRAGKTVTKIKCWGAGGDGDLDGGSAGGGGAYAESTPGDGFMPGTLPATLYLNMAHNSNTAVATTAAGGAGAFVYAESGQDSSDGGPAAPGGLASNSHGSVKHSGGKGAVQAGNGSSGGGGAAGSGGDGKDGQAGSTPGDDSLGGDGGDGGGGAGGSAIQAESGDDPPFPSLRGHSPGGGGGGLGAGPPDGNAGAPGRIVISGTIP